MPLRIPCVKGLDQSPGTDERDAEEVYTSKGRDKICVQRKMTLNDLYVQFPLIGATWLGLFQWLCNLCYTVLKWYLTFDTGQARKCGKCSRKMPPYFLNLSGQGSLS